MAASTQSISQLLNPGVPISTAYLNKTNTRTQIEDLSADNRFTQQFSSVQLGSDGISLVIPNLNILSNTVLHMQLPSIPTDVYLPRGWAIRLIDEVEIAIAGATPIRYTYRELFIQLMRDADTDAKRKAVLDLCGGEVIAAGTATPTAHLPLPLPWSSIRYLSEHVGLDSALMSQPLRVTIRLARSSDIFSGTGVYPTALTRGYVQMRQLAFKNTASMTVRQTMQTDPTALYSYHFNYPQPNVSAVFTGSTNISNQVTVNLSGFQSGNLQSITFLLQNEDDVASGDVRNPLKFEDALNFELQWNGQIISRNDEDSSGHEWCVGESLSGNCSVDYSTAPAGQIGSPYVTVPDKTSWSTTLLVARDEASSPEILQFGEDMSNQTLTLRFNTKTTGQYRLYSTFNYSANAIIHRGNATISF